MEGQTLNQTFSYHLQIASFDIPTPVNYLVFIIGLLLYLFSVFCNLTIMLLIITQQLLHKPMFYILFSLPLNDLIGISSMLPRVLADIVTQTHSVYYPTCVFQAFLCHMYAGGVLFILAAMSIDRYLAICKPLQYPSIMTPFTLCVIISVPWGLDLALILSLFALQSRVTKCKAYVQTVYCNNTSLLRLSCGEDLTVNNIYGLAITAVMQIISVGIQLFSYIKIIMICVSNRQSDTRSKAVNTCVAQLVTFFLFEFIGTFVILSYRFENVPFNVQKLFGIMIYLILPIVNPIIYGMKTKDILTAFMVVLKKKITFK
ncbi:olfactory receptor 52J3-like [Esox lucius]|uniref:G-protein coupled receptors family 1 profile domain-containing protein n=1 Tax=Esox lucius TaxID=8010 RepID=A0A3P8Y648_ESOLU|nr:olfactory receptor 52J3-like [Esox lucius]